jgi:hypothetical protein
MQPEIESLLTVEEVPSQEELTYEEHELSDIRNIRQRASLHISRELDFH